MFTGQPNPNIERGVKNEHCMEHLGSKLEFSSDNYKILTTPSMEYDIATGAMVCPKDPVRNYQDLDNLMQLEIVKHAGLDRQEVLSIVRMKYLDVLIFPCS
jgi:hypothetical protein